jgi:excisionase family DNA binding protein
VERLIPLKEAAQLLSLSRSRLYDLATSGKVPCHQVGGTGKLLFRPSELELALKPVNRKNQ